MVKTTKLRETSCSETKWRRKSLAKRSRRLLKNSIYKLTSNKGITPSIRKKRRHEFLRVEPLLES